MDEKKTTVEVFREKISIEHTSSNAPHSDSGSIVGELLGQFFGLILILYGYLFYGLIVGVKWLWNQYGKSQYLKTTEGQYESVSKRSADILQNISGQLKRIQVDRQRISEKLNESASIKADTLQEFQNTSVFLADKGHFLEQKAEELRKMCHDLKSKMDLYQIRVKNNAQDNSLEINIHQSLQEMDSYLAEVCKMI